MGRLRAGTIVSGFVITSLIALACGQSVVNPRTGIDWRATRHPLNPVVAVDENSSESREQYTPAPVQIANGDIWVYVKGQRDIYAWKSTDGITFTLENSGAPVITNDEGQWDAQFAIDPAAVYDSDTDTVHLWWKGTNLASANEDWAWGHATAPGSDPANVTEDVGSPIATSAAVLADIGGSTITDLSLSDVVQINGIIHYYGYAQINSRYQLIHATGSGYDNPTEFESILLADTDRDVVQSPTVFRVPEPDGAYAMLYSGGTLAKTPAHKEIKVASSPSSTGDWTFDVSTLLKAGTGWEAERVYAASLLKDGYGPAPILDGSSRWRLYYSGSSSNEIDQVGLAYIESPVHLTESP